jgi:ABC-type Fe3+/spermidine/putrescine transport system ATPase subunit
MILELDDVTHRYATEPAVEGVSFGVESGELVALLGPSGCGKTTLVQSVAGHIVPTAGQVRLHGGDVTSTPPEHRDVGVVFQQSTLFPHMTVRENVEYGLNATGGASPQRVAEYLDLVQLSDQATAYPAALSGGQRRRAELARALAPNPEILLLDEPLSSLDRALRDRLRDEIRRIQRETGVTTLFVTHDQDDALALADRLIILQDGTVSAIGEPRDLYESPPNTFIASFLGRSNFLPPTVIDADIPEQTATQPPGNRSGPDESSPTDSLVVHVRPEDLAISKNGAVETDIQLRGTVQSVRDVGRRYDIGVTLDSGEDLIVERRDDPPTVSEQVLLGVATTDTTLLSDASPEQF